MSELSSLIKQFAPFLTAVVVTLILTPIVIGISKRIRFVDYPDGLRKRHVHPTALGGGLAILLSAAIVIILAFSPGFVAVEPALLWKLAVLAVASVVILTVGIWDDAVGLRGLHKLIGQSVAALILVMGGFRFQGFEIFGVVIEFGHVGVIVSMIWLLGAMNAINLIDGADGVAATLGLGIFASLSLVSFASSGYATAVLPMVVTGALLGFLVYNFPPARIYLGDSGSMLIGLLAGSVAIQSSLKSHATFAIAVPIALLAIPFVDTGFAIFRRKMTGRSIYDTDRGHLHHCLLDAGLSPRQLVAVVAGLSAITSFLAISNLFVRLDLVSLIAIIVVVGFAARWGFFGSGEWRLLASQLSLRQSQAPAKPTGSSCIHIQGTQNWDDLWVTIEEFAEANNVKAMRFTLNIPWLHEAFHARWGEMRLIGSHRCWRISLPLSLRGRYVGWIEILGQGQEASAIAPIFFQLVRETEDQIADRTRPQRVDVPIRRLEHELIPAVQTLNESLVQ